MGWKAVRSQHCPGSSWKQVANSTQDAGSEVLQPREEGWLGPTKDLALTGQRSHGSRYRHLKRCHLNKGHRASVSDTSSQLSKETVKHLAGDVWNVQFLHRIAGKKKRECCAPPPKSFPR